MNRSIVAMSVALAFILSGCVAASSGGGTPYVQNGTAVADSTEAATPAPVLPPLGTVARAKAELRDKFGSQVVGIDQSGGQFTLALKWIGNATSQLNAQDAFRQVYKDAGYAPKEMLVMFHGKLVVPSTGAERDGVYAVYDITWKQAARIIWANEDQIDWSRYRTMQRADV